MVLIFLLCPENLLLVANCCVKQNHDSEPGFLLSRAEILCHYSIPPLSPPPKFLISKKSIRKLNFKA